LTSQGLSERVESSGFRSQGIGLRGQGFGSRKVVVPDDAGGPVPEFESHSRYFGKVGISWSQGRSNRCDLLRFESIQPLVIPEMQCS
jgi:hypothetical protein